MYASVMAAGNAPACDASSPPIAANGPPSATTAAAAEATCATCVADGHPACPSCPATAVATRTTRDIDTPNPVESTTAIQPRR